MAYVSQEKKAEIVALAKPILKKYGVKATFAVRHHSTIVCNIKSGKIDFLTSYKKVAENQKYVAHLQNDVSEVTSIDVNPYHYQNHFDGVALEFLSELFVVLNHKNYDNSDSQTDYFDVGHYVDVNIGNWNKPYEVTP